MSEEVHDDFADLGEPQDSTPVAEPEAVEPEPDHFADLLDSEPEPEPAAEPEPVAEPVAETETAESIAAQIAALEARRAALQPAAAAEPPVHESAAPEATEPVPTQVAGDLEYEISDDDHDLVISDPKAHATLLAAHGKHILGLAAEQARAMLPELVQKATIQESRQTYALVALEAEFPDADEAVLLAALNVAVKNNPGARTPVVVKAARQSLAERLPKAKAIAARTVDTRGHTSQFRTPTPGGRGTRAGAAPPQRDPTEQALEEIGGLNHY